MLDSVRKVSDFVGKVSDGVRKVSYGIKKSSDGARKVSDGVRKCPEYNLKDSWRTQSIFYKTPPARRVYSIRLLPRADYIFKDSWQEAYVIHMENKDLHVAIVLSPICGPMEHGH